MSSVMHCSVTSYGIARSLLELGVTETENVVQLLGKTTCVRWCSSAKSNSDSGISGISRHTAQTQLAASSFRHRQLIMAASNAVETASAAYIQQQNRLQATSTADH